MSTSRIKTAALVTAVLAGGVTSGAAYGAGGGDDGQAARARLTGYQEVPSVSTRADGVFRAWINTGERRIRYVLRYAGLSGPVQQAHIHLGQRHTNGGVSAFLCSNLGNAPEGTPACPQRGAVRGTITPADVVGPAVQGIEAGEFRELVRAMRAGATYANVHSEPFPAGEIRGQVRTGHPHRD